MPPEENTSTDHDDQNNEADLVTRHSFALLQIAGGKSEDPLREFYHALQPLLELAKEKEKDDECDHRYHRMLADYLKDALKTLDGHIDYTGPVVRALREKMTKTRQGLYEFLEARGPEKKRMKRWNNQVEERVMHELEALSVLPESDDRDDKALSKFVRFNNFNPFYFDEHNHIDTNRQLLKNIAGALPWSDYFESPQHLARAFFRRGSFDQKFLDQLLDGWE